MLMTFPCLLLSKLPSSYVCPNQVGEMRKDGKMPLYTGCKVSKLEADLSLLELKSTHGLSNKSFGDLLCLRSGPTYIQKGIQLNTHYFCKKKCIHIVYTCMCIWKKTKIKSIHDFSPKQTSVLLGLLSDDPMVANGPTSPRTSECGMWQSVSHISQVPFSLLPALKKNSRLPLLLFSASPPRHSWLEVNFESSTIRQTARRAVAGRRWSAWRMRAQGLDRRNALTGLRAEAAAQGRRAACG
jgi:hypothetical protein